MCLACPKRAKRNQVQRLAPGRLWPLLPFACAQRQSFHSRREVIGGHEQAVGHIYAQRSYRSPPTERASIARRTSCGCGPCAVPDTLEAFEVSSNHVGASGSAQVQDRRPLSRDAVSMLND